MGVADTGVAIGVGDAGTRVGGIGVGVIVGVLVGSGVDVLVGVGVFVGIGVALGAKAVNWATTCSATWVAISSSDGPLGPQARRRNTLRRITNTVLFRAIILPPILREPS